MNTHVIYSNKLDSYYIGESGCFDIWSNCVFKALFAADNEIDFLLSACKKKHGLEHVISLEISSDLELYHKAITASSVKEIELIFNSINNNHIKAEITKMLNDIKINI